MGGNKGLKIVHLNIRSIVKHRNEVEVTFSDYDIICLTESWLNCNVENSVRDVPGFNIYRQDRQSEVNQVKKRGGGILVYIKSKWAPYITEFPKMNIVSIDVEAVWLLLDPPKQRNLLIGIVYCPPDGKPSTAIDQLDGILTSFGEIEITSEIVVLGDFNIDYKKSISTECKYLKEFERNHQLRQYIKTPTRITNRVKSTIDLIFSNMNFIAEVGVLKNQISDHQPIFIRRKKTREPKAFSTIWGRTMKDYNPGLFQSVILDDGRWQSFWNVNNTVNTQWDIMHEIIKDSADLCCPMKKIRLRNCTPAWFTKEVIELINTKKEIMTRILKTNTEEDHRLLSEQKRLVRNSLRLARQETIVTSLEENRTNRKRFWRCRNKNFALGKRSNSKGCVRIKDQKGNILEGMDLVNYLGIYYATNGEKLADAFQKKDLPFNIEEVKQTAKFTFRFVPLVVVEKYIKDIVICKASGITNLSSILIKDAFKVLSVELTHIINESIRTSTFPDAWVVGSITPIPKEGDSLDPGNWCPISILPLPSKLLERAIHYQIISHLDNNGYLSINQHGFRSGKSTSTAILDLTRLLTTNYNNGKHTSCVFVDYKKAFEMLDHDVLLNKLVTFDFDRNAIRWMQSYFGNRRHVVKCAGACSNEVAVRYGVPQGSVLGPLCFILYVNDLISSIVQNTQAKIIMYADDTVLLVENDIPSLATKYMQKVLDEVSLWCQTNKMTVNAKKTKHMLILRSKDSLEEAELLTINFDGASLSNVATYKYLGVDLDRNLTYESAMHNTYIKANKKLFTLRKIRPYITQRIAVLIYKQFILPILDYADFLFESTIKYELDLLDRIQERALRLIGNGQMNNRAIENAYAIEPLRTRRRKHHLALMYRLSKIDSYLDLTRPEIDLRSRNKIKFSTAKTKLTKVMKSPYYRGVSLWDMLPEEVQRATTKVRFKRSIT